jgi:hypothetical protein
MDFCKNVDFITIINTSVKAMMSDGKIDKNDIPQMVLLITTLISSSGQSTVSITTSQLEESINSLYNYIMTHYNLFPEDEAKKTEFKTMFDMCVKLALFQPNVMKKVNKMFSCLRC